MLLRSRFTQQSSVTINPDGSSPELINDNKNVFSKCQSSSNIPGLTENLEDKYNIKSISKSISGGNINNNSKMENCNERGSTSSASGVSSPSNNSHREDEEK